jgi:hypothetical protein
MRKKLFTKTIDTQLFKQYPKGNNLEAQKVIAKIFNPYGRGRWYILNSDPQDPDYLWAIVEMNGEIEIGSVSREELETITVKPFGLNLERDLYFSPVNAKEVYDGLRAGQFYKDGGETDLKIVENAEEESFLTVTDADPNSMAVKLADGGELKRIGDYFIIKNDSENFPYIVTNREGAITYKAESMQDAIDWANERYADGGMMAKGGMVVTSIKDIPNFKERLDEGKITYRGLGMGKLYNDFYDIAGETGVRIKVDGKEYFITDTEFDTFSRGSDGKMRIRFDAPQRKGYADGGMMAKGGKVSDNIYVVFFNVTRNGKKIPVITEFYDKLEDANQSIADKKKRGEKGWMTKPASEMPVYSEFRVPNTSDEDYEMAKKIIHSEKKVMDFFEGKDSFFKKNYQWMIPLGYHWENYKLVKDGDYEMMAKGGEIGDSGIITDKYSMFNGKMGVIVGELGKDFLVRVLENGNERTVVVSKKGIDIVKDEYADGGEIESSAKNIANNPNWTNEKILKEYNSLKFYLSEFNAGYLKPSKVVGGGYKSSAVAKRVAKEWLENNIAIYKQALEMRGYFVEGDAPFKDGGKIKKPISKVTTYIPNRDVKELTIVLKGELKKVTGKDILDGVYLKNKAARAKKSATEKSSEAKEILYDALKKAEETDTKVEVKDIESLLNAGFTKKDIEVILLGYGFVEQAKVKCDNEFGTSITGILSFSEEYQKSTIDSIIEGAKKGYFEIGLKYPSFNWKKIVEKYKINKTPKTISVINERGSKKRTTNYEVFIGKDVAIGHTASYQWEGEEIKEEGDKIGVLDLNNPTAFQKERDYPAGFNGGYWGIVTKKKEILYYILETLVSQKSGYIKDLDVFENGLGGIDIEDVEGKFADGGMTPKENMIKELQKLQRDLNSRRLSMYREGDTSDEEMARKREREVKLKRFNEILETLRESDKFADGGYMATGGEIKVGGKVGFLRPNTGRYEYAEVLEIDGDKVSLVVRHPKRSQWDNYFTESKDRLVDFTKTPSKDWKDGRPVVKIMADGGEVEELEIEFENEDGEISVEYKIKMDDKEIEIYGKLKTYRSGRGEYYQFEPDYFSDADAEAYHDENWEKIEDQIVSAYDSKFAKGGKLSNYKYVPNYMINSVEVERKGKETEIDGADILDGIYVKKKLKFADGGKTNDLISEMTFDDVVFSITKALKSKAYNPKNNTYYFNINTPSGSSLFWTDLSESPKWSINYNIKPQYKKYIYFGVNSVDHKFDNINDVLSLIKSSNEIAPKNYIKGFTELNIRNGLVFAYENFDKKWSKELDVRFGYKMAMGGTTNEGRFQKDLDSLLKNEGWEINYYDVAINEVPKEKAVEMSVFKFDPYYENISIKPLPKKVTFEWVMNKINKDKVYKNFSENFNKLLKAKGYEGVNAYPTTYGIGVFVGFGIGINETKQKVESLLDSLGIDYTTEYSDAGYVFRYKISKSKENIDKINNLEEKFAKGGITFKDKVKSISKSLMKRKKVSPSVQKDYGKTYSKKEALESAKRIAGAMRAKELKMKK